MVILKEIIDSAHLLRQSGHAYAALTLSLLAVAATARRRYPLSSGMGDRRCFTTFLREQGPGIITYFKGKEMPFEDIVYELYRCALVHEAELPRDVEFHDDPTLGGLGISTGDKFVLSGNWLDVLTGIVRNAPENERIFHAGKVKRTLAPKTTEEATQKHFADKYGISPKRFEMLKWLVSFSHNKQLKPADLGSAVLQKFGGGAMTAFRHTGPYERQISIVDERDQFTEMGVSILEEIRAMYDVHEEVIQPDA